MPIDYRSAKKFDLVRMLPLVEAFARETSAELAINRLQENFMELAKAGLEQALEHPFGVVMLAEELERPGAKPRIAGYCIATAQEPPPVFDQTPYLFLTELYVLPEFRRQGIGTGLVERVQAWGLLKGIGRISLLTPPDDAAERLFARLRFRTLQKLLFYESDT
jgi:GNAT superfamily N-acetyltransferase